MEVSKTKSIAQVVLGRRFRSYEHWAPHPAVGLSCLFFAAPAALQVAHGFCLATAAAAESGGGDGRRWLHLACYAMLSFCFTLITVTCVLADYFYVRQGCRSFYGRVDIWVAVATVLFASADFCCRHTWQQTLALDAILLVAFLFTGLSPSFPQWVVRHCFWHAVGGGLLVYGTTSNPWEAPSQAGRLQPFLVSASAAYCAVAIVAVGSCTCCPVSIRRRVWDYGAQFADWRPVDGSILTEPLTNQRG